MPSSSSLFSAALRHHQSGKLGEAASLYEQILQADPRHADALHLLGVLANQLGKAELAVELISRAIAIRPAVSEFYNNFGNALKACNDEAKAENSYRCAVRFNPRNADAWFNLGVLLEKQGQFPEAKTSYKRAVTIAPAMVCAQTGLGNVAIGMGDRRLAVKYLKAAIRISPKYAPAHNALGNALFGLEEDEAAKSSYGRALEHDPGFADALFNIGNVWLKEEQYPRAIEFYQRSLALLEPQVDANNNLGLAYTALEQYEDAGKILARALEINPFHAETHFNLGCLLAKQKDHCGAIASLESALAIKPNFARAWHSLGASHHALGEFKAAETCYRKALEDDPDNIDIQSNLGFVLVFQGLPPDVKLFERLVQASPESAEAHFNLGCSLAFQKDYARAIASFERALRLTPDLVKAWHNLGASHHAVGRFETAESCFRKALALKPGHAPVLGNLGLALVSQGAGEGMSYLEQVVIKNPDSAEAHYNLACALLLNGEYGRGWPEYEWRWKWKGFPSPQRHFPQPQWEGAPLDGATILLRAEQGLGDTLQLIRYVPLVVERGGRVVLEVQPGLKRLLGSLPGIAACVELGEPLPEFSCHCPLMSLPFVFQTTFDSIPPTLAATLEELRGGPSPAKERDTLRVGLVWAGNPKYPNDALRSMSLTQFLPLSTVAGVEFVSLQVGAAAAQARDGIWPDMLPELCVPGSDFADTAAIVAGIDLVITVDTAMAHLTGSMGKPVWILISHYPEWRWGLNTDVTPWYPTARLFRRTLGGGWEKVVEEVAAELGVLAMQKAGRAIRPGTQTTKFKCAANEGICA